MCVCTLMRVQGSLDFKKYCLLNMVGISEASVARYGIGKSDAEVVYQKDAKEPGCALYSTCRSVSFLEKTK